MSEVESLINIGGVVRRTSELTLPEDARFRDAWVLNGDVVTVDHEKALKIERAGMVVSRFQARAALQMVGKLAEIEAVVSGADPITQIAWADAQEFRRDSPTINALAAEVGMTDAELDDLFRAAAKIVA